MDRSFGWVVFGRVLADVTVGAAAGFALSGTPVAGGLTVLAAAIGLAVGVRAAERKGRRERLAATLLALASAGAALATFAVEVGLPLAAGAAAIAGTLLGRERADREKQRPRITTTVVGLGGAAAIAHGSHLAPHRAAEAVALLAFGAAFGAMAAALHTGPGRPPPRTPDVALFLGLGAAAVALLTFR